MSKSSVIILIIAAVVFTGLGFVVGQVMAEWSNPGSADDPVVSESYVDKLVGDRASALQTQIDEIMAVLDSNGSTTSNNDNNTDNNTDDNNSSSTQTVSVTADSVNIRASASTSAEIVTTVSSGTVLTYLSQSSQSDGVWYNVRTSGGSTGWIRSDLCSSPQ